MNPEADPLAQLRDLAMPDGVSWWPPAPGWWLLLLLFFLAGYALRYLLRKKRAQRWKDLARAELQAIHDFAEQSDTSNTEILAQTSALFRRVAIAVDSRETVAPLTGKAWLAKLDEIDGTTHFTQGIGKLLEDSVWQKPETTASLDLKPLLELLTRFIDKASLQSEIKTGEVKS